MNFKSKLKGILSAAKRHGGIRRASSHEHSFEQIYKNGLWGSKGGGSGPGSELGEMWPTVILLADFINKKKIDRVVDLSCGAMAWWPTVLALTKRDVHFIGLDVSADVISRNKSRLASFPKMEFRVDNALSCRIDACDLLVCRETLNHLPIEDAKEIIERMVRSEAKYIAITQNRLIENNRGDENREIKFGSAFKYTDWNLSLQPFCLGESHYEIPENRRRSLAIYSKA